MIPDSVRSILDQLGSPNLNMREVTNDPHVFCDSLIAARKTQRFGGLVNAHTPNDLAESGARLFLSSDNLAGCAVEKNGNITAVFKHIKKTGMNVPDDILLAALLNGGCTLDCYAGNFQQGSKESHQIGYLPPLYNRYGFIPFARVLFDPNFAETNFVEKYECERDVIFFSHNGDPIEQVASRIGKYHIFTFEEYLSLPVMSYDQAVALRSIIKTERIL